MQYCPVALTLQNELVICGDPRNLLEYKSKFYKFASAENTRLFFNDPESFMQVPLPTSTPQLLAVSEKRATPTCQLEDYCPVALVERGELVKSVGNFIVQYQGMYYNFENKEACAKFMRRPVRYVQRAKLPSKKPVVKGQQVVSLLAALGKGRDSKGLEPADMLTFMQASVAELICQGLVDSGERRLLYPGKSPQESALLFLARFLRARNPLSTDLAAEQDRKLFEEFLGDCALPAHLKGLSMRKEAKEDIWTAQDTREFKEVCGSFDELFALGK